MPPARLPERPKPPTGQQMLADIANADDNDVVFLEGQALDLSGTTSALIWPVSQCKEDLTPSTPEGGPEGADKALTEAMLKHAEAREAAQRSYHKALELLQRVKTLEESPARLELQYTHLSDLGQEMSKVIKDLQESSSHVMQNKKEPKSSKGNKKKR
ncbi:uncharacterized protein [Littorina saxatilis]|uniref:Uncharacterized protein n=1 Tax=Littorina saxatilis TaxID=31220 RepID=A0AAN9AYD7_9CAEN